MSATSRPVAIRAEDAETRGLPPNFPTDLAERMASRVKRPLGDPFGLTVFGVKSYSSAAGRVVHALPSTQAAG